MASLGAAGISRPSPTPYGLVSSGITVFMKNQPASLPTTPLLPQQFNSHLPSAPPLAPDRVSLSLPPQVWNQVQLVYSQAPPCQISRYKPHTQQRARLPSRASQQPLIHNTPPSSEKTSRNPLSRNADAPSIDSNSYKTYTPDFTTQAQTSLQFLCDGNPPPTVTLTKKPYQLTPSRKKLPHGDLSISWNVPLVNLVRRVALCEGFDPFTSSQIKQGSWQRVAERMNNLGMPIRYPSQCLFDPQCPVFNNINTKLAINNYKIRHLYKTRHLYRIGHLYFTLLTP